MILLDTNVLSEVMRHAPDPRVIVWLDAHSGELTISAVTVAEVHLGIALLPEGRRRDALAEAARRMFEEDFVDRCLAFDAGAATIFAQVVSHRRRVGRPISTQDAQIAAIALAHGLPLATRDRAGFEGIPGLNLMSPWDDTATP